MDIPVDISDISNRMIVDRTIRSIMVPTMERDIAMIQEAFFKVCDEAKVAESFYVSLYHIESYYGGPEEGGWWGENQRLVAYQICETEEQAEIVYKAVKELAEGLTRGAKI